MPPASPFQDGCVAIGGELLTGGSWLGGLPVSLTFPRPCPLEAMADTRSSSLSRSSSKTDWWNSSRGVPCRSKKGKADCRRAAARRSLSKEAEVGVASSGRQERPSAAAARGQAPWLTRALEEARQRGVTAGCSSRRWEPPAGRRSGPSSACPAPLGRGADGYARFTRRACPGPRAAPPGTARWP